MAFMGRGKAKTQMVFSACGKYSIVACALTKRVAAVDKIEEKRKMRRFYRVPQRDISRLLPSFFAP
jgi:hypothetical protein